MYKKTEQRAQEPANKVEGFQTDSSRSRMTRMMLFELEHEGMTLNGV